MLEEDDSCPQACPDEDSPVCGSDGNAYRYVNIPSDTAILY